MERVHRLVANRNPSFKGFLDGAGIAYELQKSIIGELILLLISESDERWPALREHLERDTKVFHSVEMRFAPDEIRASPWCLLGTTSHFGYPQPEDDFAYRRLTYGAEAGCDHCDVGKVQVSAFRFRKVPTQRRSQILQMNWVFDEFFVSAETRAGLESQGISGVGFDTVVLHRSGDVIPGWYQMRISQVAPRNIVTAPLNAESCATCGSSKFNYPPGEMLRLIEPFAASLPDVFKTFEWFGSGGSAHRAVVVSQRFVSLATRERWRGLSFVPISVSAP